MTAKKMVDLQVVETSGVDHPAHMHEGFAVMKAASPDQARALWSALGKERTVTTSSAPTAARKAAPGAPTPALTGVDKAAAEAMQKAIDSTLQPILDELAKTWQDLQAAAQKADPEVPSVNGAQPAAAPAPGAAPVDPTLVAASAGELESLAKSADLPEPIRAALAKAATDVAKAQKQAEEATEVAKAERDSRLDSEAVAVSKATYGNLSIDHDTVAPLLRKMELADPAGAKVLKETLISTNAAMDGTDLLKEFGTAQKALGGDTMATVVAKAQLLVDSGKAANLSVAKGLVFESEPALADAIRAESGK